ncbi:MAG: gliding motility-associated C-terminal domain-containing protein, partial [Bacteroidales bacterium]|nr:gliding motility-associated C-terminal domain-containing protein [Bacteroidales bacterium]
VRFSNVNGGIFAGGGGGSSTYLTGATPSPGGNGGGIVFIICDTISGNNRSVKAEGSKPVTALGNAGSGGGGGGGSIALYARSYSSSGSTLSISAKGGNGGDNTGRFGEGGGGGGGLVWLKAGQLPANVTVSISGGLPGSRTGASTAQPGNDGENTNFVPALTGFLYNSIYSSVTGNQIDSICSETRPKRIKGTMPVGGIPPYNFRWEKSYNLTAWTTLYNGPDSVNYTPADNESVTVYFRRTVTDSDLVPLSDVSKPVQIIVHPYIKNNLIGYDDVICYGQNPSELVSVATLQDGNGHYSFMWESSTDNSIYTVTATGNQNYLPPALTRTTWYRRVVTSARCIDTSSPVVITVLDTIRNNSILTPPQEICEGMLFTDLQGTTSPVLSGGDNTYRFRWENSINGTIWNPAPGTNNQSAYNPYENEPAFTGNELFRRVVLSGSDDVCTNISKPVQLIKYPAVTNNIISGNQTICQGETPLMITGTVPLNGKGEGSYTFTWQDSTGSRSWTDIPGFINVTSKDFNPPPLSDTTGFRRIVYSSACISISKPVIINVHGLITGNDISLLTPGLTDTTLCYGGIPNRIAGSVPQGGTGIPGDYAYQWFSSGDNVNWTEITVSGTSRDYRPGALTETTFFRRRVISGECISESSPVKITILPAITGNTVSGTTTVCINTAPDPLVQASGTSLSGGAGSGSYTFLWEESTDGVTWSPASGVNNASTGIYQPPTLSVPMKYRRTVFSGANNCCSSVSNTVEISIDVLPEGAYAYAGPDTTINTFDYTVQMVADPVFQGATGRWTLIEGSGSFSNENSNTTRITGLSKGINKFMWTVTSGACKLEDMVEVWVYDMFIPEGFSPNDDSYNNRFIIKGLDLQNQDAELKIMNGAGTIVYSTSNLNNNTWEDWDGKNDKGIDLPEGTYYYLLRLVSKGSSQVFKKSGFIVLKRF